MPSFRMFDDEDDLGNYVEDPKLRRPIGIDRVQLVLMREQIM